MSVRRTRAPIGRAGRATKASNVSLTATVQQPKPPYSANESQNTTNSASAREQAARLSSFPSASSNPRDTAQPFIPSAWATSQMLSPRFNSVTSSTGETEQIVTPMATASDALGATDSDGGVRKSSESTWKTENRTSFPTARSSLRLPAALPIPTFLADQDAVTQFNKTMYGTKDGADGVRRSALRNDQAARDSSRAAGSDTDSSASSSDESIAGALQTSDVSSKKRRERHRSSNASGQRPSLTRRNELPTDAQVHHPYVPQLGAGSLMTAPYVGGGVDDKTARVLKDKVSKRIAAHKERTKALEQALRKTRADNAELRILLQELAQGAQTGPAAINLGFIKGISDDKTENTNDVYDTAQERAQRRALITDLDNLAKEADDDDTSYRAPKVHTGLLAFVDELALWWARFTEYLPLRSDVNKMRANFGSGVEVYFAFFRFLALNSIVIAVLYSYAFFEQASNYDGSLTELQGSLPRWTFFSAWAVNGPFYVGVMAVFIGFLVVVSTYRWVADDEIVTRARILEIDAHNKTFALGALNIWDFNTQGRVDCERHQGATGAFFSALIEESEVAERTRSRGQKERYILLARRITGMLINLAFIGASWVAIIWVTLNQTSISEYLKENAAAISGLADLAAPLLTAAVSAMLPFVTIIVTEFERWDEQSTLLKNQMWRLYIGRQLNLLINLLTYYSIAKGESFVGQIATTFDESTYQCGEDAAGAGLFSLVLTEFVVQKTVTYGTYAAKEFAMNVAHIDPGMAGHDEFRVSEGMIALLYFQSLVWISIPLYPFGSVMCALLMVLNFKWEQMVIGKYRAKPMHTWRSSDSLTFFAKFYNVTLLIAFATYYFFLNTSWDCCPEVLVTVAEVNITQCDTSLALGPFQNTTDFVPWNSIKEYADDQGVSFVYSALSSPVIWGLFAWSVLLRYYFQDNIANSLQLLLQKEQTDHVKHITVLTQRNKNLTVQVQLQRQAEERGLQLTNRRGAGTRTIVK